MPRTGRPTIYTPELVERICELVASSSDGLEIICNNNPELPHPDTIKSWRAKYDDFSAKYLLAKEKQAHLVAEDMVKIHERTKQYCYEDPITGAMKIDSGMIALANLEFQSKKWHLSKLAPKSYGDAKKSDDEKKDSLIEQLIAKI